MTGCKYPRMDVSELFIRVYLVIAFVIYFIFCWPLYIKAPKKK